MPLKIAVLGGIGPLPFEIPCCAPGKVIKCVIIGHVSICLNNNVVVSSADSAKTYEVISKEVFILKN